MSICVIGMTSWYSQPDEPEWYPPDEWCCETCGEIKRAHRHEDIVEHYGIAMCACKCEVCGEHIEECETGGECVHEEEHKNA